jgi:thiaminase/transcriptional activator TenA
MPERFTETLRAASEPGWSHAVQHPFVQQRRLPAADTFAAMLLFGRFIGMVSSEENIYFLQAFEALGATEARRAADPDTQATIGFKAIMREAADTQLCGCAFGPRCG